MISFHDKARETYQRWIETATSSQQTWLAAMIIARESEYWHKLASHTDALNQLWIGLNSDRRVEGLQWSSLDINEMKEKKDRRKKELLKLMSDQSIQLSSISKVGVIPRLRRTVPTHHWGSVTLRNVWKRPGHGQKHFQILLLRQPITI